MGLGQSQLEKALRGMSVIKCESSDDIGVCLNRLHEKARNGDALMKALRSKCDQGDGKPVDLEKCLDNMVLPVAEPTDDPEADAPPSGDTAEEEIGDDPATPARARVARMRVQRRRMRRGRRMAYWG